MNDQDILMRLLQQAYTDEALTQPARKEYEKLVCGFDENGAEAEYPVNDLDEDLERALRNLSDAGYTTQSLRYHGPDGGHILHVNLRGKKFLDMANDKRAVVVGMQDSGKRQQFETGAVRDSADAKPRPDLISPFAIERLGEWLRLGAMKYDERNWEKGLCSASHNPRSQFRSAYFMAPSRSHSPRRSIEKGEIKSGRVFPSAVSRTAPVSKDCRCPESFIPTTTERVSLASSRYFLPRRLTCKIWPSFGP